MAPTLKQCCPVYLAGLLMVVLSITANLEAATTGRKPAQPTILTPDPDKSGRRRVMDPAFVNAGKVPGIEIWRIENLKAVAYPKNDFGKFYTGDSYIVLSTVEKNKVKSWDIHFWLGSETSQDEAGAAAILTVHLDDQLGGAPVQFREVQEHETQKFLSYFKSGVRYLPGGVASGFKHVDRNQHEKKLYHIKGKRNIRVKQVPVTIASMNKGDCFVLDVGSDVFVYIGSKAKRAERLKAISAGNQIRDQDNGGRSKVHIIDEYSPQDEVNKFFSTLGDGSPDDVADESVAGDDEDFERNQEKVVTLYKVSDATGKMKIEQLTQKPLEQKMLDSSDCFVLDTTDSNIFVWVGKKCNAKEKAESMTAAQNFIKEKKYPAWTQIQRIVESGEPSSFQQYFKSWKGTGETHTRLIRSAAEKTPAQKVEQKNAGEAPEFMPDDGSGKVEVFRIENFEPVPVPKELYGKFFGGDSYLIRYNYGTRHLIYIWQGAESTNDEKASSAIHAVKMDDDLGGKATQIHVMQDHEPKHFLHIFKGKLLTFLGGKASGFKNLKDHDTYVRGATRMYCVRGTTDYNVRGYQMHPMAKNLDTNDVFIVENDSIAWIWIGKNAHDIERKLANNFAVHVTDLKPTIIEEGQEPQDFWTAIGGKYAYNTEVEQNEQVYETKLHHVTLNKNQDIKLEEISDFEQEDLVGDDVMLLDAGTELYVWIGSGADDNERKLANKMAQQYLEKRNRSNTVVIVVKETEEPLAFKKLFPKWNKELKNDADINAMKGKFASILSKFQN